VLDLLTDVLKGGAPRVAADRHQAFLDAADAHGVACLLAERCRAADAHVWPAALREPLLAILRRECVLEELRLREVRRILQALADARLRTLVIKGTALAYSHYAHAWLRPRLDTDLFVSRDDVGRARSVLEELGYAQPPFITGDVLMHQADYRRDDRGVQHLCDLHWRIANPAVFADLLPFDDVVRRARPVPALSPSAMTLDTADALLLACVHRVAHHRGDRLIWIHDVHLLVSALDAAGAARFADAAQRHAVQAICADALSAARRRCGTSLPVRLEGLIDSAARNEPSRVFLRAGRRQVNTLIWDLRALRSWTDRARLLREHLLPPAAYIRRVYGVSSGWVLPWCYAHRAVTGAARWMKRSG